MSKYLKNSSRLPRMQIAILFILLLKSAVGQIACPAGPPCVCSTGLIDCSNKNLSSVPLFTSTSSLFFKLDLSGCQLTTVRDDAFANLPLDPVNGTIDLSHNRINTLSVDAFRGFETKLKNLFLQNNNLRRLPSALNILSSIKRLDVSENSLGDNLDDHVMRLLGDSLIYFRFGDSTTFRWPRSLSHFPQLQKLEVTDTKVFFLPVDAFRGFEQTLLSLTITKANMYAVPLGIQRLVKLKELHLDHIPFGNAGLIKEAFTPLANTLETLSLRYDDLTEFPKVIKELRTLKILSLDGNPLKFISDEAISLVETANIKTLAFRNCSLRRIPGALSELQHIEELDFSENDIRSIERNDLVNLANLRKLSFSNNPLKYISNYSFEGLNNVTSVVLSGTQVTQIPEALQNMKKLQRLDVQNAQIECTCDLTWLKIFMDKRPISIIGKCETIYDGIENYISKRVGLCQEYVDYVG